MIRSAVDPPGGLATHRNLGTCIEELNWSEKLNLSVLVTCFNLAIASSQDNRIAVENRLDYPAERHPW